MSYQHDYHAGNHADVLKHSVLAILIRALQRKDTPLRVLDTHAGSGRYDLTGALAARGREYERGVARVLAAADPPPCLTPYLDLIRSLNPDGRLRHYPGSPLVATSLLRERDRLELFELHPQAAAALRALFRRHGRGDVPKGQVSVHMRDGFEGLVAVVPPPERRGLVLIDPPYEQKSDYARVVKVAGAVHRRWANGVVVIWYPLLRGAGSDELIERLRRLRLPAPYRVEVEPEPDSAGLRGSGLVIANLPYQADAEFARLLPWLQRCLNPVAGRCRAEWLS